MKKILFLMLAVFAFQSCDIYPNDEFRLDELDVVITYYDTEADFDDFQTYVIVDSVRHVVTDTMDTPEPALALSEFILTTITSNMDALNYVQVDDIADADLAVDVGAVLTTNVVVTPGYPGYWAPCGIYWCQPGFGWGYPGYGYGYPYYPGPTVSSWESGTLLIDFLDLKNFDPDEDENIGAVWSAIIRGVTEASQSEIRSRIKTTVDQSFEQSPYLGDSFN